jgi:DNA invertase Pin-like site-specific DNA recombinase
MALLQLELGKSGWNKTRNASAKLDTARQMYADSRPEKNIAEVLGVSRPTVYRALESVN